MTRETTTGLHAVRLRRDGFTEVFITITAVNGEEPARMFQRLDNYLLEHPGTRIVRKDVFGLVNAWRNGMRMESYGANGVAWPVTWVEEGSCSGCPVAGIQVHAVTGIPVEPIRMDGRVVGTVFEDAYSRYCLLGDLRPESSALPRIDQARQTYEMMEAALRLVEMDFSHVLRTWLYLDQILAWYREFNLVRDAFYSERGVFDRVVPASTAVGGSNSAGTAVVANLFAAKAKDQRMRLQNVPSPLQCPALTYGSSFSRAVELILPSHRRLFVSGTASIAPDGSTIHVGNVDAQVAWTMDVVNAILQSRQMGWMDVTRAIGYFKRADDAPAFDRYCLDQGLPPLPAVIAKNDICRDELLFEFEVDAIREVR